MALSKRMNETVKRAIRVRLEHLLEEEEKQFQYYREHVAHKLNDTRQKQIEREYNKRVSALKIVIYMLTPYFERTSDQPTFVIRKSHNKNLRKKPD